jgi:RNA polymerase sigma-70 factor (sigma-E family)
MDAVGDSARTRSFRKRTTLTSQHQATPWYTPRARAEPFAFGVARTQPFRCDRYSLLARSPTGDGVGVDAEDEKAFREFVTTRWQALVRTTYLLVGDHGYAEDLVQTALLRAHRRGHRIERLDAPEVYVKKILVNLASSYWRRRLRFRESPVADLPEDMCRDTVAETEERDELWSAVQALPPRMRAVLVLRYFEDLSEAETASVLGCSTGTVKSQASRGVARLREGMSQTPEYGIEKEASA